MKTETATTIWKGAAVVFSLTLIASSMHDFGGLMGALALSAGVLYLAFREAP